MTLQERIVRRKIGAFELLVGAVPVEIVFGSWTRLFVTLLLAVAFYAAKREFKGEFSLLEVFGLFTDTKQPSNQGNTKQ